MLTRRWTKLRYHEPQSKLWRSSARFVAVAAGRGSGKTELARRRVVYFLNVKRPWPNPLYFYALPTFNQAKRVAWKELLALIPKEWIRKKSESDLVVETHMGSELHVLGLDKPMRAEGVQWDGGIIDESSDQKPGIFDLTFRPAFTARKAWCWRIGVPKRHGVGAQEFKEFFYHGADESYTWASDTVLSPQEIEEIKKTTSEDDYDEQYRASWLDSSGIIFSSFSMVHNVQSVEYNPNLPIVVGQDFNINPMCWTLSHVVGNKLLVFNEVHKRHTNTMETLDYLASQYQEHLAGWEFIGDASARAKKTSAETSDYVQIKNHTGFEGRVLVNYSTSNPSLVDRFAACNALFHNAKGEYNCLIDPRCKYLIKDLDGRQWKPGTRLPDDNGDSGHMSDSLGYVIYRKFPLTIYSTGQVGIRHG